MSSDVHTDKGANRADLEEPETTGVMRRFVAVVKAEEVELHQAAAAVIFAEDEVEIDRGGARDIVAGGSVKLARGGAGLIITAGDTTIRQGGAGSILSLGSVQIEQGGAGSVAAGSVTVGRGGLVLLALTPRLEVAEGGRLIGGPAAVFAAGVGIAIGIALGGLIRRRRR